LKVVGFLIFTAHGAACLFLIGIGYDCQEMGHIRLVVFLSKNY